jgi:hypothetical protein
MSFLHKIRYLHFYTFTALHYFAILFLVAATIPLKLIKSKNISYLKTLGFSTVVPVRCVGSSLLQMLEITIIYGSKKVLDMIHLSETLGLIINFKTFF